MAVAGVTEAANVRVLGRVEGKVRLGTGARAREAAPEITVSQD